MKERRRTKRIKEEDKVTISINSEVNNKKIRKTYHVLTKDISTNGFRIPVDAFIPVNTVLKIKITLENPARLIYAIGKVQWVRNLYNQEIYETGIEFIDMPPYQAGILEKHIRKEE